jgi:hypothetical protein
MGDIIGQIQAAGYVYNLSKGGSDWASGSDWAEIPPRGTWAKMPPRGTEMNCRAAALLAMKMAADRDLNLTGLKLVATRVENGFFIPSALGVKALGRNDPPVRKGRIMGWEFSHHYRVMDILTGKVYDPTFGTSGNFNPVGVKCTSTETVHTEKGLSMTSVYGNKYKITWGIGSDCQAELISHEAVANDDYVDDEDYR